MKKLILEFDNEEERNRFLVWLADAGGQQDYDKFLEMHNGKYPVFDYGQAFEAWGWDSEEPPMVKVIEEML